MATDPQHRKDTGIAPRLRTTPVVKEHAKKEEATKGPEYTGRHRKNG